MSTGLPQPATLSTAQPTSGVAIPVIGAISGVVGAGPAQPVYLVTDADVAAGRFRVGAQAPVPMTIVSGRQASAGNAIPVYVVRGTLQTYAQRIQAIAPQSLIGYWPLDDLGGTRARDLSGLSQRADYPASGATLGGTLDPTGTPVVTLSGADTAINIRTTVNTFGSLWNGNAFSLIAWGKVDSASRWTDTSTFRYLSHIRAADATYYAVLGGRNTTNNQIEYRRRAGGAIVSTTYTFSSPPTDFFCMGMTCNQATPALSFYLWDSAQGWQKLSTSGAAQSAWTGNAPVEGTSVLGAGSLTLQEWIGGLAHCAVWNTTLTDAQMRTAMVPVV